VPADVTLLDKLLGRQERYPREEQVEGESVSRRNSRNTHIGFGFDGLGVK
jgi:hypothetical protein